MAYPLSIFLVNWGKFMKKNKIILMIASMLLASSVNAQVKLEDNSLILGKWDLYAEAPAMHKEKKAVKIQWEFKKGDELRTSGVDPRTGGPFNVAVKYSIEDGAIKKQVQPGRSKTETCNVKKLDDKDMILQCKYLFFFLKRK